MNSIKKSQITGKHFIVPATLLLLLFLAIYSLSPALSRAAYVAIQQTAFINLNDFLNETLGIHSYVWSNLTYFGNALVTLLFLSVLIVKQTHIWAALLGAVPLASMFAGVGKNLAAMPRPAAVLNNDSFIIIDRALTGHSSLPSGHTITVFCLLSVVILSLRHHRQYPWIFLAGYLSALVLAISRVAVGAHWPIDVAVGALLGYIAALSGVMLVERYHTWWAWMKQPKYAIIWVFILVLFMVILLTQEHSFSALNGTVWLASFVGLSMVAVLVKTWWSKR